MKNTKSKSRIAILLLGGAAALGIAIAQGQAPQSGVGQPVPATVEAQSGQAAKEERTADEKAVRKALAEFATAFGSGNAKAVGALFTAEGEYVSDDGTTIQGRAEVESDYAEFFKKNPENALDVEVETIRYPSRDNAVVEGYFKLRGPKGDLAVSRGSFLYAREDGKWLIAIAREWPGDGVSLRDLEWLIGIWEAKRDGTTVTTKYEWTKNKTFIRCHLSIAQDGKTLTGTQMIGKMPSTGGLHIWTFEDAGGIGDADITRDGKKWLFAARGSTADGRVLTATNIMTPVDADSFLWQSVERTVDGEPVADLPPVKVTRVKSK